MTGKYRYLKVLQGHYGPGCSWEDLSECEANDREALRELRNELQAYRDSSVGQPWAHRIISRRVLNQTVADDCEALPRTPKSFTLRNISDVKAANKAIGNHYFSPDTMRFFNGKVYAEIFHGKRYKVPGVYFVTSERCDWGDSRGTPYPRKYSVRFMPSECGKWPCPHGSERPRPVNAGEVFNASEFEAYSTKSDALKAAAEFAATDGESIPVNTQ